MIHEADEFQEEDRKTREKVEPRNMLEQSIYKLKQSITDNDSVGDSTKETIDTELEELNKWLDDNSDAEKEEYDKKLQKINDLFSLIQNYSNEESNDGHEDL